MRWIVLGIFFCNVAYANLPETSTVSGGWGSLDAKPGYQFQIGSPPIYNNLSVQIQIFKIWDQLEPFTLLEAGLQSRLYEANKSRILFKTMLEWYFTDQFLGRGLHWSCVGEQFITPSLALTTELGLSLGFASWHNSRGLGTGMILSFGPRIYF